MRPLSPALSLLPAPSTHKVNVTVELEKIRHGGARGHEAEHLAPNAAATCREHRVADHAVQAGV